MVVKTVNVDQYHVNAVLEAIDTLVIPMEAGTIERLTITQRKALYNYVRKLERWMDQH